MGKKQNNGIKPQEEAFSGNLGSPFADLKMDVPPPPEPPKPAPPPPPTREETMEANLSRADKAMLAEFRKAGLVPEPISMENTENKASRRIKLNLSIQRKGHKGRVVTIIRGLDALPVEERMEICSQIRTALGCGARFVETILEVQGDQREKASKWLENRNFVCII